METVNGLEEMERENLLVHLLIAALNNTFISKVVTHHITSTKAGGRNCGRMANVQFSSGMVSILQIPGTKTWK